MTTAARPEILLDLRVVRERLTGVGRYLLRTYAELQTIAPDLQVTALVRRGQTLPAAGPTRTLPGAAGETAPLQPAQWWRLPRALRGVPYDLFHYTYFDLPPVSRRTPLVATCYDLEPLVHPALFPPRLVWYSRLFVRALRRADRVVTISHATARDVERFAGLPAERIVVTHLGVDTAFRPAGADERARVRAAHGLPERYVFYVGNTLPHKNLGRLVEAMARVRRACGPIPLILAGAPDRHRPALEAAAAQAGVAEGVRFLGQVPDADLPGLLSAASVFAYPSLYEGFGLPVLEAMACGAPVVTSNRASLPEVVGDAAEVCDPLDVGAIAGAIEALLSDDARAARRRAAGLARAAEFTWARCAAAHHALYRELVRA